MFPWTSLRAIAEEHPGGSVGVCIPNDDATRLAALLIERPPDFYRFWAMLDGPAWVAIHYDGEARPDWVWHGIWSGDNLRVASVSPYDPTAHASVCDLFFGRGGWPAVLKQEQSIIVPTR